jgi:putative nucleotidyltransferase with HDIG domain
MQDGALDYVTKPFALDNVVFRVDRALTRNEGLRREIQHDVDLARLVANRTGQLRAQKAERSSTILAVFGALLGFLEERDPHSRGHSARVARQAVLLGRALGLPAPDIRELRLGALFHDIGKIGIPDTILRNPGPLTPAEARRMRSHPAIGADALKPIPDSAGVAQAVRHHHEHVNGKGYPDGLVGDEIPLASRIIAVADAVDAMGSARPYRERHSDEYIRAELERQRGQQWDTDVVAALLLGEDWHSPRAQNEQERETWNDTGLSVH